MGEFDETAQVGLFELHRRSDSTRRVLPGQVVEDPAKLELDHRTTVLIPSQVVGAAPKHLFLALGPHVPDTLVLVTPHVRDVDGLADDVSTFSGTACSVFPAWETLPREEILADWIFGQRLRLLGDLEGPSPPRYLVTSFQALLQPVPSRESLRANTRTVCVGMRLDEEELIQYCNQRLSSFKRPRSVVFIDELPRNVMGKVLKRDLREQHG